MAAHLHRYHSELRRLRYILKEVIEKGIWRVPGKDEVTIQSVGLEQLLSKSNAVESFCDELERKVQNILTLVS